MRPRQRRHPLAAAPRNPRSCGKGLPRTRLTVNQPHWRRGRWPSGAQQGMSAVLARERLISQGPSRTPSSGPCSETRPPLQVAGEHPSSAHGLSPSCPTVPTLPSAPAVPASGSPPRGARQSLCISLHREGLCLPPSYPFASHPSLPGALAQAPPPPESLPRPPLQASPCVPSTP